MLNTYTAAAAGVLFNVLLPRWLQTVLLTILLVSVVYKTLSRGLKMWRSERKDAALKARLQSEQEDANLHHHDSDSETEGVLHDEAYHLKPHRYSTMKLKFANLFWSSHGPLKQSHEANKLEGL